MVRRELAIQSPKFRAMPPPGFEPAKARTQDERIKDAVVLSGREPGGRAHLGPADHEGELRGRRFELSHEPRPLSCPPLPLVSTVSIPLRRVCVEFARSASCERMTPRPTGSIARRVVAASASRDVRAPLGANPGGPAVVLFVHTKVAPDVAGQRITGRRSPKPRWRRRASRPEIPKSRCRFRSRRHWRSGRGTSPRRRRPGRGCR